MVKNWLIPIIPTMNIERILEILNFMFQHELYTCFLKEAANKIKNLFLGEGPPRPSA